MTADTPRRTLLQRQLHTLQSMALAYGASFAAMAQMNLQAIGLQNQTLEAHCRELGYLQRHMSATIPSAGDADLQRAVMAAGLEVRRLNRVFRSVARRSARHMRTQLNVLNPTGYSPSASERPASCHSGSFQTYV
jgi:hypothetical protein